MFTLNAVAVCGFRERSIIGCTIGAVVATREMDKVYMQVFEREREREVCFDSKFDSLNRGDNKNARVEREACPP